MRHTGEMVVGFGVLVSLMLGNAPVQAQYQTGAITQQPTCKDAGDVSLPHTTVGIQRIFDDDERVIGEHGTVIDGVVGTATVRDEHTLLTIHHVIESAYLDETWKVVTLFWEDDLQTRIALETRVRVKEIIGSKPQERGPEQLVLLETEEVIDGFDVLRVRFEPLQQDEPVIAMGYNKGVLRVATGNFAPFEMSGEPDPDAPPPPDVLPFELVDFTKPPPGDRYALDHGTSGGPIFDCSLRLVALVQNLMTTTMDFSSGGEVLRVTTPWGMANVIGTPTDLLHDSGSESFR